MTPKKKTQVKQTVDGQTDKKETDKKTGSEIKKGCFIRINFNSEIMWLDVTLHTLYANNMHMQDGSVCNTIGCNSSGFIGTDNAPTKIITLWNSKNDFFFLK